MNVEFLRAWDNNTWDTTIEEVPDDIADHLDVVDGSEWDGAVLSWANEVLAVQTRHRGVVLWAIYNANPDGE